METFINNVHSLPDGEKKALLEKLLALSDEVSWSREENGSPIWVHLGIIGFCLPFVRTPWEKNPVFLARREEFADQFIADISPVGEFGDNEGSATSIAAHYRLEGKVLEAIREDGISFSAAGFYHPAYYKDGELIAYVIGWHDMLVWC